MSNQCENKNHYNWTVEIDLNMPALAADVSISALRTAIRTISYAILHTYPTISIGMETNENGEVIRLIVILDDETSANAVAAAVNALDKGSSCTYGLLCQSKEARVVRHSWVPPSSSLPSSSSYGSGHIKPSGSTSAASTTSSGKTPDPKVIVSGAVSVHETMSLLFVVLLALINLIQ